MYWPIAKPQPLNLDNFGKYLNTAIAILVYNMCLVGFTQINI